jgi:hypothetical protein
VNHSNCPKFVVLFYLLFSLPTHANGQSQGNVSNVVKATVDSVVLIVISDASGKPLAQGSGFIASSDGKVVTNHHVIDGAHSAIVKLNNGAFFAVDGVIADDRDHDIAILKVSGNKLPTLQLADSDALTAGDHVVAIGSPLGLENSVSDGIISGFRKDRKGRSWIQTTAPTSHGNSGGPLLTMDEKVAGIITLKAAEGENLNFAVPSNVISNLLTNTTLHPLEAVPDQGPTSIHQDSSSPSIQMEERVWTSLTAGYDYSIRTENNYIYVRWVNLPAELQSTNSFITFEFKKSGDKWVGRKIMNMVFSNGHAQKSCREEFNAEIDELTNSRIAGRAEGFSAYNAEKCRPEKVAWKPFTWIPK